MKHNIMLNSADLYLGTFLILCGFALSLLNLRRVLKDTKSFFPAVLISENILLMCIGISFVSRSVHEINPLSVELYEVEKRTAEIMNINKQDHTIDCKFLSVLMSYGPLIISLVNSFLSLIINNYMHYRMVVGVKKEEDENTIQEVTQEFRSNTTVINKVGKVLSFWKKYFSYIAIALQWVVPVLVALSMYPIDVKLKTVWMDHVRSTTDFCMAMVDVSNETCTNIDNYSLENRKYIPSNYLEVYENEANNITVSTQIDSVIKNVLKVIQNFDNKTEFVNVTVTSAPLTRKPKESKDEKCMNICYLDNKSLLLYMFAIAVISYFVPITISTIILTKIHVMNVKNPNVKTYVNRELLYNILFWTPVMFDTFLSLILCSYSMKGMRTSIFNVIANVYQALKNFMNTQYFKDNTVSPI